MPGIKSATDLGRQNSSWQTLDVNILRTTGGVSKNTVTPKWMVYNGKPENLIKIDDLGVPVFLETPT